MTVFGVFFGVVVVFLLWLHSSSNRNQNGFKVYIVQFHTPYTFILMLIMVFNLKIYISISSVMLVNQPTMERFKCMPIVCLCVCVYCDGELKVKHTSNAIYHCNKQCVIDEGKRKAHSRIVSGIWKAWISYWKTNCLCWLFRLFWGSWCVFLLFALHCFVFYLSHSLRLLYVWFRRNSYLKQFDCTNPLPPLSNLVIMLELKSSKIEFQTNLHIIDFFHIFLVKKLLKGKTEFFISKNLFS